MVFIKHAAVLDQLCNHKQAIPEWSTTQPATCCCKKWEPFKAAALNPSDPHWVLAGSLLHSTLSSDLAVIVEGSLLNKVFPSKKEYFNQLKFGLQTWTKRNGLPSMPVSEISDLSQHLWTEHSKQVTCHITKSSINSFQQTFEGTIFHCEDILSMLVLPSHRQDLSGPFDIRIGAPRSRLDSCISCRLPPSPTWQILPLGGWTWPTTTHRIHFGETEKRLSEWSTNHLLCEFSVSTHAQHPRKIDLSIDPSGVSKSLCLWGCLHTPFRSQVSACRRRSHSGQPGSSLLLHQH